MSQAERIEEALLRGPRRYTRAEAAAAAGVPLDQASRLWHALGFPHTGDADAVFTDTDIAALRAARALVDEQIVDAEALASMSRMLGQTMSRLAQWQSDLLASLAVERPEVAAAPAEAVTRLVPLLEHLQTYVWRRHLAASADRLLTGAGDPESRDATVGFADLTGYTSLVRRLTAAELATLLEEFEAAAADIVADHRGRIVKSLGDEVLFTTEEPADAAQIALRLLGYARDDRPSLRIGLAAGRVLARFGDVYGSVVNIASRLTDLARPGSVLVDRVVARALADDPRFSLQRLRPVPVRGFRNLEPWRLRGL